MRETSPDVLFVCETKIDQNRASFIKIYLNFDCHFCVKPIGTKGGLLMLWNLNANLSILSYSSSHIDVLINFSPHPFYFSISMAIRFITYSIFLGVFLIIFLSLTLIPLLAGL